MKLRTLAVVFSTLLFSANCFADSVRVDFVAFTQASTASAKDENWKSPQDLKLDSPKTAIPLNFNSSSLTQGFAAASNPQVEEMAANLKRGSYKIIASFSWIEPLQTSSGKQIVFLQGGQRYGNHYELEGTLDISQVESLIIQPHVWLSAFAKRNSVVNDPLPENPIIAAEQNQTTPAMPAGAAESAKIAATNAFYEPVQVVELSERRESKQGELNYFDHPLFGVLIRVSAAN